MEQLSLSTLSILSALLNIVVTAYFTSLWIAHRTHFHGIGLFAGGMILLMTGNIAVFWLKNIMPFFVYRVLGSTLIVSGTVILADATKRFTHRTRSCVFPWLYLLIPLIFFFLIFFSFVRDELSSWMTINALGISLPLVLNGVHLLRHKRTRNIPGFMLAFSFFFQALAYFALIPLHLIPRFSNDILLTTRFYTLAALIWTLSIITWPIGFALLISTILAGKEREKAEQNKWLLKEMHHRVKNNLTLVRALLALQSDTITDDRIKEIFTKSINRIDVITHSHSLLSASQTLSSVPLDSYLEKIIENIKLSCGMKNIRFHVEIDKTSMETKNAISCGLVINELVTNSCKYAFDKDKTGEIKISLKKNKKNFTLIVRDNGRGIGPQNEESLGLTLVRGLAEQLGGELRISGDAGTRVEIRFPA